MADVSTITDPRQQELSELARTTTARQATLDAQRQEASTKSEAELTGIEGDVGRSMQDESAYAAHPPTPTEIPPYAPRKVIDQEEYQALSWGLLALAAVGGAASHGNWLGVSSAFNGAMKGYLEGNQERAHREMEDYKQRFSAAKAHDEQANKEFEAILKSKSLTVNQQLERLRIAAQRYGRQDLAMQATQKSIDGVWKQIEAGKNMLTTVEARYNQAMATIKERAASTAGGTVGKLTDDGRWFRDQAVAGGNLKVQQMLQSRYGGAMAADTFNNLGKVFREQGLDPRDFNESQINLMVQRSAQTQATNRKMGVERLTKAIEPLERRVVDLAARLNGHGIPAANKTLNWVTENANLSGTSDLSELKTLMGTVGRQYVEAGTMPGSNAQMHATAQEWANSIFNANMSIDQILGTLRAMNEEIRVTSQALSSQIEQSRTGVSRMGPTITPPGGAAPVQQAPASAPVPLEQYLKSKGY